MWEKWWCDRRKKWWNEEAWGVDWRVALWMTVLWCHTEVKVWASSDSGEKWMQKMGMVGRWRERERERKCCDLQRLVVLEKGNIWCCGRETTLSHMMHKWPSPWAFFGGGKLMETSEANYTKPLVGRVWKLIKKPRDVCTSLHYGGRHEKIPRLSREF